MEEKWTMEYKGPKALRCFTRMVDGFWKHHCNSTTTVLFFRVKAFEFGFEHGRTDDVINHTIC
jgi:hypothetical protein